ncbi:MAG: Outer rane stress sensor protease DegS, partial [Desertimonas sp.]|nr:Outer rane stress sensor protease DegS [Desertimonas sp.]
MRRTHGVALAALSAAIAVAVAVPAIGANGNDKGLSKHDRALLAEAKAEGKTSVIVLVAAKGGAANDAIRALEGLGGTVQYRDAALGYIRASLALDKVSEAASLASVEALDLDETVEVPDPRPEGAAAIIPQPVPGAATPRVNPYMPTGDTGAAQFVNANPTWDGRNVTIGVVDTGVSLDHPSLTTTSTGQPKIIDWVTGTDPVSDDDPTWVNMAAEVSGASFAFGGVTYTAPAAGSYRIGVFNERDPRLGGEVGRDVNRDGNPAGSSGIFAVLWEPSSDRVWVDTNQNASFADQTAMRNYKVNRDVGYFGTDNPA